MEYKKFYPNKWIGLLTITVLILPTIGFILIPEPPEVITTYDILTVVMCYVVVFALLFPFILYGTAQIKLNEQVLLYKKNIFRKAVTISLDSITNVYLSYRSRSRTIEISTDEGKTFEVENDYALLVALYEYIPENKFTLFYAFTECVPKKQREFLLSTNIPKKGPFNNRGGLK